MKVEPMFETLRKLPEQQRRPRQRIQDRHLEEGAASRRQSLPRRGRTTRQAPSRCGDQRHPEPTTLHGALH